MEFYGMSGEKLGIIGESSKPAEESIPEWKRSFTTLPSISIRKGIASNFDTPYEDTSTLVLTAPSGKFVDIRLPLGFYSEDGSQASIIKHPAFWAFSGTVKTTFLGPSTTNAPSHAVTIPYAAHAIFEHDIDSKGPGIIDEGDMFLLPNGDSVEVGVWTNPSTGKYEMYKEYWTEPETARAIGGRQRLEADDPHPKLNKSPCIVVETEQQDKGKGIFIRIGDFAQGLFQPAGNELILFARYEKGEDPLPPGKNNQEPEHGSQWHQDPRSTGHEEYFPVAVLSHATDTVDVGSDIHTTTAGWWKVREYQH